MKIYIGNLPYKMNKGALARMFKEIGAVRSINIAKDRESGMSRGFGFVEMVKEEDALTAISTLNGTKLKGRAIRLEKAKDSQDDIAIPESIEPDSAMRIASCYWSITAGTIVYMMIYMGLSLLLQPPDNQNQELIMDQRLVFQLLGLACQGGIFSYGYILYTGMKHRKGGTLCFFIAIGILLYASQVVYSMDRYTISLLKAGIEALFTGIHVCLYGGAMTALARPRSDKA